MLINSKNGIYFVTKIELDEIRTKNISDYFLKYGKVDEKIIRQFTSEYVVDFCLCNYDAAFRNFIILSNEL